MKQILITILLFTATVAEAKDASLLSLSVSQSKQAKQMLCAYADGGGRSKTIFSQPHVS